MNAFEYARPATVEEAIGLLSAKDGEVAPLAGGTDLLSLMKDFVVEPKRLVSLMGIAPLQAITVGKDGLRIGATVTLDALLQSGALNQWAAKWPALWHATAGIRSLQLRAMGTVGGELLQRPRCWYFRRGHGLLAQEADGSSMVEKGDHRYHAVFGNAGPAKFVHASSLAPALIACGATAEIASPKGNRTVQVEELYRTPATAGERETALAADELLVAVTLPRPRPRSATYEVRPRQGLDWPLAAAAVAFELDGGGKCVAARVALGHVAPTPWSVPEAAALVGKAIDAAAIAGLAAAVAKSATPLKGNAYKVELAQVALRRACAAALKGA
ncbi:MAG: molybdopterin dehydrogenase [Planctomycetes bacterium]|nr:molybdopterin dehydrogenase [Planctomycetota bacterium]